jgi:hypothetical protein
MNLGNFLVDVGKLIISNFFCLDRLSDATAEKVKFANDELEMCKYLIPDILPEEP